MARPEARLSWKARGGRGARVVERWERKLTGGPRLSVREREESWAGWLLGLLWFGWWASREMKGIR